MLPHPRKKALLAGSNKEDLVRRYVEEQMALVSRRYVKKYSDPTPGDDIVGYKSMSEVCKDIHKIIDVLWLSGTRKPFHLDPNLYPSHPFLRLSYICRSF